MYVELIFVAKYVVLKGLILQLHESATVFDLKSAIESVLDISVEDLELTTIYGLKIGNSEKVSVVFSENERLRLLNQGINTASVNLYTLVVPQAVPQTRSGEDTSKPNPFLTYLEKMTRKDVPQTRSSEVENITHAPQTRSSQETLKPNPFLIFLEKIEAIISPANSDLSLSARAKRSVERTCNYRSKKPKMVGKMATGKGVEGLNLMAKPSESLDEEKEDIDEDSEVCNTSLESQCPDRRKVCCNPTECDSWDTRPPYAKIPPENRQYAVMIVNDDSEADVDIQAIMAHLFSKFEECPFLNLDTSNCVPVSRFENWLMFVTEDYSSSDWITDAVADVCPPHSCLPFIQFFGLVRAHFVLPLAAPGRTLCSIFQVFENQNCGLVTHQWAVIGRYMLDPSDSDYTNKIVSTVNDNEEIDLFVDEASRDFILEQCSKIKYCFWHLSFRFPC